MMEKDSYRLLIEHLPDAFAYHQIILDDQGIPVDYIFLEVNKAFEEMTGLKRQDKGNVPVSCPCVHWHSRSLPRW
jgi:PAS domain-containing protein